MRSRSKLALFLAALLLLVGTAVFSADPYANGWTKEFKRGWGGGDQLHVFCDGPHRVYIIQPSSSDASSTISVIKDGCLNWPTPAPTPRPPAEAPIEKVPLQKGKP